MLAAGMAQQQWAEGPSVAKLVNHRQERECIGLDMH